MEVSEPRLAGNYRAIAQAAGPGTTVLAVIKANAYGHGALTCAPMLARAGAPWLGVTSVIEGAAVRRVLAQTGTKILIMCGILPAALPAILEHCLTPVVWTIEQLDWLGAAKTPIAVHLEVDTGMSRQGVRPGSDLEDLLAALKHHPSITLDGVFTHFCSSEVADSPLTARQQRRFEQAMATVAASGLQPNWVHAGNTSAVDNPPPGDPGWVAGLAASVGARALVRTGLALYGHTLEIEGRAVPHLRDHLQPVLTWKTRIVSLRDLAPGETVGYNAIFTAPSAMRVALLTVGYADGLRRELSNDGYRPGGWMMVHGRRAPILGRISMNLTSVDVTGIPNASVGDEAVVLGEGITAEDHARLAGTIPYEILCGIHPCP